MTQAIECANLVKHFGDTRAVDGIDLSVARGSVYGLLGPNGAGKTTVVRLLSTLLRPTSGSARVLGCDLLKEAQTIRTKVSLTGQFASVDEELTGRENLILIARLLGHSWKDAKTRAQELLHAFSLHEASKRQVTTYSGGMRRRLDIAASLIATPELLFLDEPTTGLDPRSRNQVWAIVSAIAAEGATVLLTTQYLEEADQLADRLAVIDRGKMIAEGTGRELKNSVGSGSLKLNLVDETEALRAQQILIDTLGNGLGISLTSEVLTVQLTDEQQGLYILNTLNSHAITLTEYALGSPSLDEVFFALTGKPVREESTARSGHQDVDHDEKNGSAEYE